MHLSRRTFLFRIAGALGGSFVGHGKSAAADAAGALRAGLAFLSSRQSSDGGWRSTHYGFFREGDALTPLVLWAMQSAERLPEKSVPVIVRGLRWLEELTATQAQLAEPWAQLRYPLFTASYAAQVFAHAGDRTRATFWANLVEHLRIDKSLGWPEENPACGAWSDAPAPPQLPSGALPPPDMIAPNVSATFLGLRALAAVGRSSRLRSAQSFVEQCQNFADAKIGGFDDGGFFFAVNDPIRNKAGVAGKDGSGERYRSYGSATCDGILALALSGLPLTHPRIRAAFEWLRRHSGGARHGGDWPANRTDERDSLVYYHAQALADVLQNAVLCAHDPWAREARMSLRNDLIGAQDEEGAWIGLYPNSFEDDPLVATAFGVRALSM